MSIRIYPKSPSFIAGEDATLCVEPNSTFTILLYRQDKNEELTPVGPLDVNMLDRVTVQEDSGEGIYYESQGSSAQQDYKTDWQWPSLGISTYGWTPGVYVALIFSLNPNGHLTTEIRRKFKQGVGIKPIPPDSDSMALFVVKPFSPTGAPIAYILPVATYHAYNWTGNGCFYGGCPKVTDYSTVTIRRPGGGLGAVLREPPDDYDPSSPRQQFAHWDARFIRWLKTLNFKVDFYTDIDLDKTNLLLKEDGTPAYKLLLSIGHHEYWSQSMYDHVKSFIHAGGNYAVFSGNTCYRKVSFGDPNKANYGTFVSKVTPERWTIEEMNNLLGISYDNGAGRWGDCNGEWTNTTRSNIGYTILQATSWVFALTHLTDGTILGGKTNDFLIGYECDGAPSPPVSGFVTLAESAQITNWTGNDMNGRSRASMVLKEPSSSTDKTGTVFNCGTTDWARVLTENSADAHSNVQIITWNILTKLAGQPGTATKTDEMHSSRTL